jgi:rhamnosyltransferase
LGKIAASKEKWGRVMTSEQKERTVYVLMSTYNGQKYVEEQINSILNQIDCKINLIVRDDGSTDNTKLILKEYSRKGLIIFVEDDKKMGPAQSFFRLVELAPSGSFYAFADQDDYWKPDKMSRAIRELDKNDTNIPLIYYSNAEVVDQNLNSLKKNVYGKKQIPSPEKILCGYGVQGCSMVFNDCLREIFLKEDISNLRVGMHDFFLCDVCVACGGKIIFDDETTMKYRQHENNVLGFDTKAGRLNKLKKRIQELFVETEESITDDADILMCYEQHMSETGRTLVLNVQQYKKNFAIRMRLAGSLMKGGFEKKELLKAIRILMKKA